MVRQAWFLLDFFQNFLATLTPSYRPFVDVEHPVDTEIYRLKNPIVEENGVKKFKLEFDLRRFNQNEVKINTNAKDCCLMIEAKKSDQNSKFEYCRKMTIPHGVKPNGRIYFKFF